jgi:hypothetical protein
MCHDAVPVLLAQCGDESFGVQDEIDGVERPMYEDISRA